jgi:queuine tRNA-ribosyltransferase
MNSFSTTIIKTDKLTDARVTKVYTPHGTFNTPTFMPVGTRAAVNLMNAEQLHAAGSEIILGGNTYHMLCTPGLETIEKLGGMHNMMNWHAPMLTDSGGFQIFSLSNHSDICKIDDNGAKFRHPKTGQILHMNAASSIAAQKIIGADIIMAFDQCTPNVEDQQLVLKALDRTHRWLAESIEAHQKQPNSAYGSYQALFGIIQGGVFPEYRTKSTEVVCSMDLDGIAIGGETIGFDMQKTCEIINWVRPMLPENKCRYTMGVGLQPQDLIDVVKVGIDIFDCVAPTRNARHGALYHGHIMPEGDWFKFVSEEDNCRISIKKSIYKQDDNPILTNCECYTCQHYSRGYLHYLFKEQQVLYSELACIHNVHVMQHVCTVMREHILNA